MNEKIVDSEGRLDAVRNVRNLVRFILCSLWGVCWCKVGEGLLSVFYKYRNILWILKFKVHIDVTISLGLFLLYYLILIKLRFSSLGHWWPSLILAILFRPFGLLAPRFWLSCLGPLVLLLPDVSYRV